jgi:uncharacterized protein YcfJ
MKKYALFVFTLVAASSLSFTQAFHVAVIAVGGQPDCNGSDISLLVKCSKKSGIDLPPCTASYRKVTSEQPVKDVLSTPQNVCMDSGCKNILANPTALLRESCTRVTVNAATIDP